MDSAFGKSFIFLTKLAWNCKVTLPVLVTAVFLAMDFRMQIELNIETEQLVFQVTRTIFNCDSKLKRVWSNLLFYYLQDEIDDSDEYETVEDSDSGDDYEYDNDNSITS